MFLNLQDMGLEPRVGIGGHLIITPTDSFGEFVLSFPTTLVFSRLEFWGWKCFYQGT